MQGGEAWAGVLRATPSTIHASISSTCDLHSSHSHSRLAAPHLWFGIQASLKACSEVILQRAHQRLQPRDALSILVAATQWPSRLAARLAGAAACLPPGAAGAVPGQAVAHAQGDGGLAHGAGRAAGLPAVKRVGAGKGVNVGQHSRGGQLASSSCQPASRPRVAPVALLQPLL